MMNFKWDNFAFKFHVFGLVYHLFYIAILFAYTFLVYIHPSYGTKHEDDPADGARRDLSSSSEWKAPVTHRDYVIVLLLGISYPFFYEFNQMYKNGVIAYFSDLGNWVDMLYLAGSVSMGILHMTLERGAYAIASKILMLLVITLAIRRTFNYLRIFDLLSPIVSMIN